MRRILVAAILSICSPLMLHAQLVSTPAEDSTLAGIRTIGLLVLDVPWNQVLGASNRERLTASTQLELRKTGLRVVVLDSLGNAASNYDAALVVVFLNVGGRSSDLRLQVRQPAKMDRTGRAIWATTWTWEIANGGLPDAMLTQGTNAFLAKWLDMNGR